MRHAAPLLAALCLAAAAQQGDDDRGQIEEGMDHLSEGSRLILEAIIGELMPMMEELRGMIDDMTAYEKPEVLPNGDIIIRRKRTAPLPPPEDGEIDL